MNGRFSSDHSGYIRIAAIDRLNPGISMLRLRKERPLGVTVVGALCICGGPMSVLTGLVWLIITRNILLFFVPFGAIPLLLGIAMGLLGASLLLVIGIGLLGMKNWARLALIVLIGYGLLDGIALLHDISSNHLVSAALVVLAMGTGVWLLRYLLKPHVKVAFGATRL